jgi:hypothetical protein
MIRSIMQNRAFFTCAVLALALLPPPAHAQPQGANVTSSFTKEAVAVRPGGALPVFGQVAVGQRIDYVLSALAQGPGGIPASGIVDVLLANQSYVSGSLHMPPGWTATPAAPYTPNPPNQTIYSAPAAASMLSFQLPVGGNSLSVGATGMGDGMYPIPGAANGNIYAVFHHLTGGSIDCWSAVSLARCATPPRQISAANDLTTLYNFNGVVVQKRYIYYPAVRGTTATGEAGLGCWDTLVEQACTFQPVGGSPGIQVPRNALTASGQIAGALLIPGTSTASRPTRWRRIGASWSWVTRARSTAWMGKRACWDAR